MEDRVKNNETVNEKSYLLEDHGNLSPLKVTKPKKRDLWAVLVFACLGNVSALATRMFPSGFYIEFLREKGLNKTVGTICISMTLITSAISPYLFKCLPDSIKQISLTRRYLVLSVSNAIFLALMGVLDVVLDRYPSGELAFAIIFVLRSLQGFTIGLTFVIVQGEVVDLYLKDHKVFIVIISSSMHVSNIICSILGVRFYMEGGWIFVGPGVATLSILPLLLIPAIKGVQGTVGNATDSKMNVEDLPWENNRMTGLRRFTYYMPDLAVFFNNMMFNLLIYVLPARMVEFTGRDLDTAILFINLINVFSFISALILGNLAGKMFNVFNIIVLGNVAYYIGCILAFGSTTKFLHFPFDFEMGSLLVGLGDAAVINLAIMSKFVMFEKWGVSVEGLGARSTAVHNLVFNLASAAGTILSGFTLTRGSEIPALGTAGGIFIVVSISLVLCKLVK